MAKLTSDQLILAAQKAASAAAEGRKDDYRAIVEIAATDSTVAERGSFLGKVRLADAEQISDRAISKGII